MTRGGDSRKGVVFSVKVGGNARGSAQQILAKALLEGMREGGWNVRVIKKREGGEDGGRELSDGVVTADQIRELARWLIDDMDMKFSAQAALAGDREARYNEVVRASFVAKVPMLAVMARMLRDATREWREAANRLKGDEGLGLTEAKRKVLGNNAATLRGKVRGMATMLAYVSSPFTFEAGDLTERARLIKQLEEEAGR